MAVSDNAKIALEKFVFVYQSLNKHNLGQLGSIYADDVRFIDPAHEIHGWSDLHAYFERLYSNINSCEFVIHNQVITGETAFLNWTMNFSHPKLERGKQRRLSGCTRLLIKDGRVVEHQDYFDMGAMIYEALPLLGRIIRKIKTALGQA